MYSLVRSQRETAVALQNVSDVNRERSRLAAASSVCDSTKRICLKYWYSTRGRVE